MKTKKIKVEDIYEFDFIGEIIASEDGNHFAFIVNKADEENNNYKAKVYAFEHKAENIVLKEIKFDVFTGKIKLINISNSGNLIVYGSIKGENNDSTKRVMVSRNIYSDENNEVFEFMEKPEKIIYSSLGDIFWTQRNSLSEDSKDDNFIVFDELPFWSNGNGIIDKTRLNLYVKKNDKSLILCDNLEDISNFEISKDGKKLAYIKRKTDGVDRLVNSVVLVDTDDFTSTVIHSEKENLIHQELCFLDDNTLFFAGFDSEFPGKNHISFMYNLDNKKTVSMPFLDVNFSGTQVSDVKYGSVSRFIGKNGLLYFTSSSWGNTHLYSLDKNFSLRQLTPDNLSITDFALSSEGFYSVSLADGALHSISFHKITENSNFEYKKMPFIFNNEYQNNHLIYKPERFVFTNRDGIDIEVFVILPDISNKRSVPVILQIHGGPKTVYGSTFNHEFQVLASNGFASVFLNPRGSDGRGSEFANITGELGFMDYEDIIEGFDEALDRYPILDKNRAGVSGGSYGGFMVNWIICHNSRFKAACSQRSISSYFTKPFTTDIGYYHNLKQLKASPWESFETVNLHSPLANSKRAATPTLFIHSDEDYRCWQIEGISMYNALKMNGVPSKMVLFYGENHNLSRTGKPYNRVKRLFEILSWFNRYLK